MINIDVPVLCVVRQFHLITEDAFRPVIGSTYCVEIYISWNDFCSTINLITAYIINQILDELIFNFGILKLIGRYNLQTKWFITECILKSYKYLSLEILKYIYMTKFVLSFLLFLAKRKYRIWPKIFSGNKCFEVHCV